MAIDTSDLVHLKCINHAGREAVARCTTCGLYYCRECVVEHEDEMICSLCLDKQVTKKSRKKKRAQLLIHAGLTAVSMLLLLFLFFVLGHVLSSVPSSFHEGTFNTEDTHEK